MSGSLSNLAASALALAFVLLLAWLAIKGLAKVAALKTRNGRIQVIESLPISARERLIVVLYKDQELLLGVTSQSVSVLTKTAMDLSEGTLHVDEHGQSAVVRHRRGS